MFSAISSFAKRPQKLPEALTSHDLLKALALVLMFVDHIGYFFFPEESWFRVIGRLSVPIWFFLIGYADTRKVQNAIWLGALVVLGSALVAGEYLFPANILFTLALARLWIDRLMAGALQSYESFAGMFFLLFFLGLPTIMLSEYGTIGMMLTVFGYLRRHKENMRINRFALFGFLTAISFVYISLSAVTIPTLTYIQLLSLIGGMFALMVMLFHFKSYHFSGVSRVLGKLIVPLQFMGRHTLLIYVAHVVVLRGIVMVTQPDRFMLFDFEIMPLAFLHVLQSFFG